MTRDLEIANLQNRVNELRRQLAEKNTDIARQQHEQNECLEKLQKEKVELLNMNKRMEDNVQIIRDFIFELHPELYEELKEVEDADALLTSWPANQRSRDS